MSPLLRYVFDYPIITSSGSFTIDLGKATVGLGKGPGNIPDSGTFNHAIDLGTTFSGQVDISKLGTVLSSSFRFRIAFRPAVVKLGQVVNQNLFTCQYFPFSLSLIGVQDRLNLTASVTTIGGGTRSTETYTCGHVTQEKWHYADVVFDNRMLSVFLDGGLEAVHGYGPFTWVEKFKGGNFLYIGGQPGPTHFNGSLAMFEIDTSPLSSMTAQLDSAHNSLQFLLTAKLERRRSTYDLGVSTGVPFYNSTVPKVQQDYSAGSLLYSPLANGVFEMHGEIWKFYQSLTSGMRDNMGALLTDEEIIGKDIGRSNTFTNGSIYWSPKTGAQPVYSIIDRTYRTNGGAEAWGFPVSWGHVLGGGWHGQRMERSQWLYEYGMMNAIPVFGEILNLYDQLGGHSALGGPLGWEAGHRFSTARKNAIQQFRTYSGTPTDIYWSAATGAHAVAGPIADKYSSMSGPDSKLGFPITNTLPIPNSAEGTLVEFEHGTIVSLPSLNLVQVVYPFKFRLGLVTTQQEDDWFWGFDNDLFFNIDILSKGKKVSSVRLPGSGSLNDRNNRDLSFGIPGTFQPHQLDDVTFRITAFEADPTKSDVLGTFEKRFDPSNAWGLAESNGAIQTGKFGKVNNLQISVQPEVNEAALTQLDRWWGVPNNSTDTVSWETFSLAFADAAGDAQAAGGPLHALRLLHYEVQKHMCSGGNCFGMCAESMYAQKHTSAFSLPLNRFTNWGQLEQTFNVRHLYQIGLEFMMWFARDLLKGNQHNPGHVWDETLRCTRQKGEPCCVGLFQSYWIVFGVKHVVKALDWHPDTGGSSGKMDIMDPTNSNRVKQIDFFNGFNAFSYQWDPPSNVTFEGDWWSGSRIHFIPYHIFDHVPKTPFDPWGSWFDACTVIIFGAAADSQAITNDKEEDINGLGDRAEQKYKNGEDLYGFFLPAPQYDAGTDVARTLITLNHAPKPDEVDASEQQPSHEEKRPIIRETPAELESKSPSVLPNFTHVLQGNSDGALHHVIAAGGVITQLRGTLAKGENVSVGAAELGASQSSYAVTFDRARDLDLTLVHRFGYGEDSVRVIITANTVSAGTVQLRPVPGLDMIDLIAETQLTDLKVHYTVQAGNSVIAKEWKLAEGSTEFGAIRLRFGDALEKSLLSVSPAKGSIKGGVEGLIDGKVIVLEGPDVTVRLEADLKEQLSKA